MAKNLTFWSTVIGFLMGYAVTLSDRIAGKISQHIPILNSFEYRSLAVIIPALVVLAIVFHFVEKQENEKNEHNFGIYTQVINRTSKEVEMLSANVEALVNEIRKDRNERNNNPKQ